MHLKQFVLVSDFYLKFRAFSIGTSSLNGNHLMY
jgi:hypothetical protein